MNSTIIKDRIEIIRLLRDELGDEFKRDVFEGLTARPKSIPSKYLYDARGADLFKAICRQREYYQTTTELSILKSCAGLIMEDYLQSDVIEFGSGEDLKIRMLLERAFDSPEADICYIPVDVSEPTLVESAKGLCRTFERLRVSGMVADFTKHLEFISHGRKKLFLFFGSTVGNFSYERRSEFLSDIAAQMEDDDRFILGVDMIKPVEILEHAYNDSRGLTAEFNKNVLNVLNRRLRADFDRERFDHLAFYNAEGERVEMHLRAKCNHVVKIRDIGLDVPFQEGETIRTEICKKFSRSSAGTMAEEAGMRIGRWYTDPREWFSLLELSAVRQDCP